MTTIEGYRALVVPADGAVRQVVLEPAGAELDALRWHIGCDCVEHVRGPGCSVWVDEEFAIRDNPPARNPRIDRLLDRRDGWPMCGTAVISGEVGPDGDVTSLSADDVVWLMEAMGETRRIGSGR